MHICTQRITHESIINIFSLVCYGNVQDNVALQEEMQDKRNTKYPGGFCGVEKKKKKRLIGKTQTAFSCLFLFISHICRKLFVQ